MKFTAKVKIHPICEKCKKPIEGTIWTWQGKPYCGKRGCLDGEERLYLLKTDLDFCGGINRALILE